MTTVALEHADLPGLIERLTPGEEVTITVGGKAVAVVTKVEPEATSWPSRAGTAKDRAFWMAPDFDAPLDEFGEDAA